MIDNNNSTNPFNFLPHVSKEFILSKISEADIFSRYLYYPDLRLSFVNPFRDDKNPDCKFYISSNSSEKIRFKDFAYGYNWSCFDVVMIKYNLDFHTALQKIAIDFDLFNIQETNNTNIKIDDNIKQISKNLEIIAKKPEIVDLQIKKRRFNNLDLEYWEEYNLQPKDLYYVYPLDNVFLNKRIIYSYNSSHIDPAYAYALGNGKYKIYFPNRKKKNNKSFRFLQSGSYTQGSRLLPKFINNKYELLFITKSYKDVLMLRKLGFYAIAPSSETSLINKEEFETYQSMFNNIVLFFDNDNAGIVNSNRFKDIYKIESQIFTPEGYSKDISDFIKNEGEKNLDIGIDLIAYLITTQTKIKFNYDTQKIQLSSY